MNNADRAAYPTPDTYDPTNGQVFYGNDGLTKREYFAAMAMQGLCANSITGSHNKPSNLAIDAVMYADALLKELDK